MKFCGECGTSLTNKKAEDVEMKTYADAVGDAVDDAVEPEDPPEEEVEDEETSTSQAAGRYMELVSSKDGQPKLKLYNTALRIILEHTKKKPSEGNLEFIISAT